MTAATDSLPDLLRLTRWLSPAFPLGSFAYSHGLEWAVSTGEVRDGIELQAWIGAILRFGSGRQDAILLTMARRDVADPDELAELAAALAAGAERLTETSEQGRAFVAATGGAADGLGETCPLPVALGIRSRSLALADTTVSALYLSAFAGNLVSCGQRLLPLGQLAAQGVLEALEPVIAAVARDAAGCGADDLHSGTPGADLAALAHETQAVRLFRS